MSLSTAALAGAFTLDVLMGEPPRRLHPVALFGRLVGVVDRGWRHPRLAGALAVLSLSALAALAVAGTVWLAGRQHLLFGAGVAAGALFVTTSFRRLVSTADRVIAFSASNPEHARTELRALAGRDADDLSPGQIRSAAVESLAENLADGLVAPLLWYTLGAAGVTAAGTSPLGAVAAGCGAAAWVKAVNTFDSMLGYHSVAAGWGPARLDDAVMWLPARMCAILLAVTARCPRALSLARRWLPAVPSPNSGWPMATLAVALGVRLEKPGAYVIQPDAPLPAVSDGEAAVRLVVVAGAATYVLVGLCVGVLLWL